MQTISTNYSKAIGLHQSQIPDKLQGHQSPKQLQQFRLQFRLKPVRTKDIVRRIHLTYVKDQINLIE